MTLLTDLQRLNAARTSGPWLDISNNRDIDSMVIWDSGPEDSLKHHVQYRECSLYDEQFICAAASAMDRLLAVVDAAETAVGGWDYEHAGWVVSKHDLRMLQKALRALESDG